MTAKDAERARSLLGKLSERSKVAEVKSDLDAVIAQIPKMSGRTSREAIDMLMKTAPRRGRGKRSSGT